MADKTAPVEEIKNCTGCNKPLKKAKRFYRNGKYYCNNNCFKAKVAKDKEKDKEEK